MRSSLSATQQPPLADEAADAPAVLRGAGIERIRFATSHPRYFTERLIRACSELPKLCEFFHIPFQSGDNDILRAMKRGGWVVGGWVRGNLVCGVVGGSCCKWMCDTRGGR